MRRAVVRRTAIVLGVTSSPAPSSSFDNDDSERRHTRMRTALRGSKPRSGVPALAVKSSRKVTVCEASWSPYIATYRAELMSTGGQVLGATRWK